MRVFFIRHGQSEANTLRVFSNRGWKHALTETGREQVRKLADALQGRGVSAVISSPLRRAVESAEILSEALGAPCEIAQALVEYDVGTHEDRSDAESWDAYAEIERRWAAGDLAARLTGGESCEEIRNRFVRFMRELMERFANERATLALVGHGGTFRHALPVVLENLDVSFCFRHRLPNAAVVEAVLEDGHLLCTRWHETVVAG
jgi:probable phosphoglycerate mutase